MTRFGAGAPPLAQGFPEGRMAKRVPSQAEGMLSAITLRAVSDLETESNSLLAFNYASC
jgi:hypothetical protein